MAGLAELEFRIALLPPISRGTHLDGPHLHARRLVEMWKIASDDDAPEAKAQPKGNAGNGNGTADWSRYLDSLHDHDTLTAFAMALVRSGMSDGAAVNFLRSDVAALEDIDVGQKQRRLKEIPGMVESARGKLDAQAAPQPTPPAPTTLDGVHEVFQGWLGKEYDTATLDAVLAVATAKNCPAIHPG